MSNFATGAGSSFQIGKETTYGTSVPFTEQINFLSESLKLDVERLTEDSLMISKTARSMDVMGYMTSGDVNVILKPENAKEIFYLSLGVEGNPALVPATTEVFSHDFTLQTGIASLPSFCAIVDRKVAKPVYTGLKVSTLKLDMKSKDYVKAALSLKGSGKEESGALAVLTVPSMKAYRFVNGSLTIDGTEFADVTSVELNIDNSLSDGEHTLGSGYYTSESEHDERVVTVNIECFYNAASNTIRETKYKTDGASCDIEMTFESPELIETGERHRFTISMPNVVITEASPNVTGKEKIGLTINGQALETNTKEAITVEVFDGDNSKSFA